MTKYTAVPEWDKTEGHFSDGKCELHVLNDNSARESDLCHAVSGTVFPNSVS